MEGEDTDTDNPRSFQKAAWWKRLIILAAGAFMNFVTGVLIFAILYLPVNKVADPVITQFTDCCQFNHEAGLKLGDRILELDGEKIYMNSDISMLLSMKPAVEHDVVVLRDGQRLVFDDLSMGHTHVDENGQEYLHFGFGYGQARQAGFWDRLGNVWNVTVDNVRIVRLSLQMLLSGQANVSDVSGPVGIVQMMSDVAASSGSALNAFLNMLSFGGMIAVNLAVMNLLPIPALDGGRIVGLLLTTGVEAVTRKKLNPKIEGYIHGVGMLLLLGLMALIMFKDIFAIFKG
jgi:regulator of sigma E protease